MIGKTISHYEILEKLGAGGMGVVYKAQDAKLDRFVALKFLPPHLSQDEENKKRFIHEAKAASALDHPNICTIYEIDETEDGQMFIAMACYDGESLKEKVAGGKLQVAEVIDIAIQIAQGLAKAHSKKIIHRDIKPANILLTEDGQVKIVDFGLAKLSGRTMLTKEGTTLGTVAYMSPEQSQGVEVDPRTDIWSLGVVLYEMLTGQLPFQADYELAVIYSIINEEPEPVTSIQPEVSSELAQVVQQALAKEADTRYASAADLLADLEKLKSGAGLTPAPEKIVKAGPDENSVAVIAFSNITGDSTVDWLASGIAETVTVDLKKIAALKVVSREKISKFLGGLEVAKITEQEIIDLGSKLGVKWTVWGGFQKMGNSVRITAHFTEVGSGDLVGTTKVDGSMDDIFKLQDQIITNLLETLQLEISDSEIKKIAAPETLDVEAYEYFAKGRQLFNQFGKASFDQAKELFEKAIEIDPKYALAYSGLGSIHIFRFIEQTDPRDLDIGISHLRKAIKHDPELADPYLWLCYGCMRKHALDDAVSAGQKAVQLESDNPMAHYFLGAAYHTQTAIDRTYDRYSDAIQHYNRNIELQPNYQPAHMNLAWIYMLHGNYQKAQEHLEKAVWIEESGKFEGVKFIGALTLQGCFHFRQHQFDAAAEWYQRSLKRLEKEDHLYRDQFVVWTHCGLGDLDFCCRRYDQALKKYKSACAIIEKNPKAIGMGYCFVRGHLGMAKAFHKLGMASEKKQQLQKALDAFNNKQGFDFSWIWEGSDAQAYYDLAGYYALANRKPEAFKYLRKAIKCGFADLTFFEVDDSFALLRKEPEFQKAVQEIARQSRKLKF